VEKVSARYFFHKSSDWHVFAEALADLS